MDMYRQCICDVLIYYVNRLTVFIKAVSKVA